MPSTPLPPPLPPSFPSPERVPGGADILGDALEEELFAARAAEAMRQTEGMGLPTSDLGQGQGGGGGSG